MSELEKASFVTTTADIWSTKHRSYLGMTVHYVDHNTLERKSAPLCCRRFKSPHDNVRIAEMISSIHEEFNLTGKVIGTVTDNAANFAKSFKEFGISMDEFDQIHNADDLDHLDFNDMLLEDQSENSEEIAGLDTEQNDDDDDNAQFEVEFIEIPENILPVHFRCAAHTLALVATKDVEKIQDLTYKRKSASAFEKVNSVCKKSNKPKSSEIIHGILGKSLIVPCKTRWNSLFDTVSKILEFDIKIMNKVMVELELPKFTNTDYEFLQEYVTVMGPIARGLDNLQGNCYFAYLLPTIHTIKSSLEELDKQPLAHCSALLRQIGLSVSKRFSKYFTLDEDVCKAATIATCSHPYFKMRWLHRSFVATHLADIKRIVVEAALQVSQSEIFNQSSQQQQNTQNVTECKLYY